MQTTDSDGLGLARGILIGTAIGLLLWCLLIVCGRALFAAIIGG